MRCTFLVMVYLFVIFVCLQEECGWFHVVCICLTLCGCMLIARPPFLFGSIDPILSVSPSASVYDNAFWGATAALCGTLFAANVYVVIRSLKVRKLIFKIMNQIVQ